MLAWHLTMAKEYGFLDRVMWGTDYVGEDADAYLASVAEEVGFYRDRLNPILESCGWPTLSEAEIDGLLGGNARSFLRLPGA